MSNEIASKDETKVQYSSISLRGVEVMYDQLAVAIRQQSQRLLDLQHKGNGAITLSAKRCGNDDCQFCPHVRWVKWIGGNKQNYRWYAVNIKSPLANLPHDAPEELRDCVKTLQRLLEIRANLVQRIAQTTRYTHVAARYLGIADEFKDAVKVLRS